MKKWIERENVATGRPEWIRRDEQIAIKEQAVPCFSSTGGKIIYVVYDRNGSFLDWYDSANKAKRDYKE